jgi:hypothetical protein
MTHVRTSPYYPQSNGKSNVAVEGFVEDYNDVRSSSAIVYVTPQDMLARRRQEIDAERDRKLEVARKQRQIRRQQAA